MSARSDLYDLIAPAAPVSWEILPYPTRLRTFDDPAHDIGVIIEQRTIQTGDYSDDPNSLPVVVELALYVIADGSRGDDLNTIEDRLEAATEQMVRILAQLPDHVWDGQAVRDTYDDQKPCYTFTIRAAGALTQE